MKGRDCVAAEGEGGGPYAQLDVRVVATAVMPSSTRYGIFSRHAHSVWLLLYDAHDLRTPVHERVFEVPRNKTGPIWHCRVPLADAPSATYYAYRIEGPPTWDRRDGDAFDPDKVLVDPYAKSVFFPPSFDRAAAARPGSNAGLAPLGLLNSCRCERREHAPRAARPPRHGSSLVIYEVHVRGFTQHRSSGVSVEKRGTFAGLVEKIPYLVELGITAVELMPVFQFDPQEGNYWGYMPLNFFAVGSAGSTHRCKRPTTSAAPAGSSSPKASDTRWGPVALPCLRALRLATRDGVILETEHRSHESTGG